MVDQSGSEKVVAFLEFVELASFTRKWFEFGEDDESLGRIEHELNDSPEQGELVREAHGLRKIRAVSVKRG